jgi:hypothetical protein
VSEPVRLIQQALIFGDQRNSQELGQSLWTVLHEVQKLFARGLPHIEFANVFLVDEREPQQPRHDWSRTSQVIPVQRFDILWRDSVGKYRRTIDPELLADQVRFVLGSDPLGCPLFIVTDQEISPPTEMRYALSALVPNGAVISMAPTDPKYWNQYDSDRVALIKQRVRAVCCALVARWCNLFLCENPRCFLYHPAQSVVDLDDMRSIGTEHKEELTKLAHQHGVANQNLLKLLEWGWEQPTDPNRVQPPVRQSNPGTRSR